MKHQPIKKYTANFEDDNDIVDFGVCCDSVIAVLTDDEVEQWFDIQENILHDGYDDYDLYWTGSFLFIIDGKNFMVVSDAGEQYSVAKFHDFCENGNIQFQYVIDGLECEGIEVHQIYTGECEDNLELLSLLHKVYN